MQFVGMIVFAVGHLAIFVEAINRLHSTAIPRSVTKALDITWYLFLVGIPVMIGSWFLNQLVYDQPPPWSEPSTWLTLGYMALCCLATGWAIADRMCRLSEIQTTELLKANHTQLVSVRKAMRDKPTGDATTEVLSRLPFNEILHLSVHEKKIVIPRLDPALNGLRITHLSDLHMTGQLSQPFYEHLVEVANSWESDIVAITGDIVEKTHCLPWVKPTLGKLRAKHGTYFVLGNHELRIRDEQRVRDTLTGAGLINLGGEWKTIEHAGQPIVLFGNELPWFRPTADMATCPTEVAGKRALRLLLTHSPDQLRWARKNDCDLMLAGHTHGGQVRLPLIGPILSPSWQGSRFASGTFYYEPTLMHVSRGIAGTRPLRLNCRPELARLVLSARE